MEPLAAEHREAQGGEPGSPSVVHRDEIPATQAANLAVRRFLSHAKLGEATACPGAALALIEAKPGRDVELRSHASPSLVIVLRGACEITGKERAPLEEGDVVTLPRDHEYGFTNVGAEGLQALLVTFPGGARAGSSDIASLPQLLARNEARTRLTLEGPYFRMLASGVLESSRNRDRFRDGARVLSDAFQVMLFTRQATAVDPEYAEIFHEHLEEEIGHNRLLSVPRERWAERDPILRATAAWFCHQMLVLDNAGKAVVHLVLETAGFHFHTLAKPVLASDVSAGYFAAHSEADDEHKDVVIRLLEGQHPETYRRLHRVLEDAWDMFDALSARITELVEIEAATS